MPMSAGVTYGDRQLIPGSPAKPYRQARLDIAIRRRSLELLAAKHDASFGRTLLSLLADLELRPDVIRAGRL